MLADSQPILIEPYLLLRGPLEVTAILFAAIILITWRHHPWGHRYGAPVWDYTSSFASNLGAFTGAVNALLVATTSTSVGDAKLSYLSAAALFGLVTALAPLLGAAWKSPSNQTYFGGVVLSVLAAATGGFGQIRLLIEIAGKKGNALSFDYVLCFAGVAVFVYCLSTADRLARTPPATPAQATLETVQRVRMDQQPWALP